MVSISNAMTTNSKAIMERMFFLGIHLSVFNWLLFIEFAIWFIFQLTAHQWTELYLKVHHLASNFKWMILL